MPQVNLFLSTVSAEFRSYRDALRHYLERPNISVKIQEDFIATGSETLDKLDEYIRQCDAVIHLVGDMTGALAQPPSLAMIRTRYTDIGQELPPLMDCLQPDAQALSYTQWEAWLALYHRKTLIIAVPTRDAERDSGYTLVEEQRSLQQHLARLAAFERYPEIEFANTDRLAAEVLRSRIHDILGRAGAVARPFYLPNTSIRDQFMGRDDWLEDLSQTLGPVPDKAGSPAVSLVLSGLGGIGKTRLALEYAWRHADSYSARLFVGADTATALQSNLAALTQSSILDLPEQTETDEGKKRNAVISWFNRHPGWLMVLDNVDSEASADAVEDLIARLSGGHIVVTSRLSNYSNAVTVLHVNVLSETAASEFLLRRTDGRRRTQPDDRQQAEALARELDCLPLALEQAGAYIAKSRMTLKKYLQDWSGKRDELLKWNHPRLMNYPTSVFVTWETSFDQLGESARQLLQRLAWLSPEPIPETLLDVPVPHVAGEGDPFADLAELEGYSLVTRATDSPSFTIHKLVQEVTRLQLNNPEQRRLNEMLHWLNAAFDADPQDVKTWPVLEPLAPHALAIVQYADEQGIPDPTSGLMNRLGSMYHKKALYAEAEPLMLRALAITEASFGAEHPTVASCLNNLAQLLQATNRLAEAEPLMQRALAINEASFGAKHPKVAILLSNLATLLQDTNRLAEAEPLMRRALAIDEASFGAEHPNVARDLNNLAQLLKYTNRPDEAEPQMRRVLAIAEASFGTGHPEVAITLNNLAQLLQATNRLAEAEPLMRRALAIDEASFDAEHPKVAIRLNNLAALLQATNRLDEAEPLMRRALAIAEASSGADHPNVATCLNSLAQLLQDTNRLDEAEPLMRRALAINEASFGIGHPKVAITLNNLAQLLQATNRLAEAEPLMQRALTIYIHSYGFEHPHTKGFFQNYFLLGQDLGWTKHQIIKAARCSDHPPTQFRQGVYERETVKSMQPKVGRNDPCPCRSGKKFKKCCGLTANLH